MWQLAVSVLRIFQGSGGQGIGDDQWTDLKSKS
jgi:hypothetical protein